MAMQNDSYIQCYKNGFDAFTNWWYHGAEKISVPWFYSSFQSYNWLEGWHDAEAILEMSNEVK